MRFALLEFTFLEFTIFTHGVQMDRWAGWGWGGRVGEGKKFVRPVSRKP